jgi:type I restriction enzyme M protein
VEKLWSYCNVLRDDGVSAIDYVEQLTFLLFLKMAHERETRALIPDRVLPTGPAWDGRGWQELMDSSGEKLTRLYQELLEALGREHGTLGTIFGKAQNRIQDSAKLRRLVRDLIGQENWSRHGNDVNGDAYEELLKRSAEDVKSGAGQYFTPRALIRAIVDCMQPTADETITDPACGTGGFLLAAAESIYKEHGESFTPNRRRELKISGTELVENTARLAAMNLLLHGIGTYDGEPLVRVGDALARPPAAHADVVLANPPFGKKSSITVFAENGRAGREDISYERSDFWVTTTNKQINFVQHIAKLLTIDGRAAVVIPDNVLTDGGAGEIVRRQLLAEYDVHTLLRLPTGIFFAGGVKANVLFFDRRRPEDGRVWTEQLWVYDLRVGQHFTLKQNPLRREHLQDFVDCYRPGEPRGKREEAERFKPFSYEELIARDKVNLDITWLKDPALDDAEALLPPEVIAAEIVEDLQAALTEFAAVAEALQAVASRRAAASDGDPVSSDE